MISPEFIYIHTEDNSVFFYHLNCFFFVGRDNLRLCLYRFTHKHGHGFEDVQKQENSFWLSKA